MSTQFLILKYSPEPGSIYLRVSIYRYASALKCFGISALKRVSASGLGGGKFLGETSGGAGDIIRVHENELNTSVAIDANNNGLAAGPLTIASGVTLTINGELSVV